MPYSEWLRVTSRSFLVALHPEQIRKVLNGNMTAYRLQSETSWIGYQSINGSSSRRVFSCTTVACAIYHPAICPACVSRSLSIPAADAYDQLHAVTSSSHATKTVCYGPRSFGVAEPATWNSLPASLRDDQLYVAAFRCLYSRLNVSLARSWLFLL